MQHHLGHAAREEDAHGRVVARGRSAARRRGAARARLTPLQSSTVGPRSPAAWAIAGMCSSRFVEPPNAAWTSHRVVDRRGGEDVASVRPSAPLASAPRARRPPRHVEPDRLARRRERGVRQRSARAPRRRPARSPRCRGTGSRRRGCAQARQPSSAASSSVTMPVREARAERLHRARVLAAGAAAA